MSKLRKQLKKINAGILAAAVVISSLHISGAAVEAAEPEFNTDDVVLKVGVLSDPHFAYSDDDANAPARVEKYKNAITYLNNRASNELDMIMVAGDYTGTGSEAQATIFAKATKEALASINEGKKAADATKFIFAYGNHDTDWGGQMDYAGWENVLNQYGVLDSVEKGPEGCYQATVTNDGKTYHFFSLETYTYNNPCNMFLTEALDWLDDELKAVTTNDPTSYVYVVSHGPIGETGVYGSDIYFDKNANWGTARAGYTGTTTDGRATSSDVNGVLKKYPQVVYFSGHTHWTNMLESSIMQKDYTAINVSSLNGGDLFSAVSGYVEDNYQASRPAFGLLVEVDGSGNQKITRINLENNSEWGEPWIMEAPNAEKTHLTAYSQAARQKAPVFADGAALSVTNVAYTENKDKMTFDIGFPAASCDNNIIRYELVLYDQNGNEIDTKWMVGNWTDHTTGVAEGTNHLDATKFAYSFSVESAELTGVTGFYAKLFAIEEFGGKSTALTWKSKDSLQEVSLLKPVGKEANKNMFDGLTAERVFVASHQDVVSNEFNSCGNLTTNLNLMGTTDPWTSVRYIVSEEKYNHAQKNGKTNTYYGTWGASGVYPEQYTDLKASDTYVYETDFSVSSCADGSALYLQIRTPDLGANAAAWKSDYSGVKISTNGTELYAYNAKIGDTSEAFKLSADSTKHHVIAVTSQDKISVWIDDILVFDNVSFVPDLANEAWADLASTTMLPTMAIFANNLNVSISGQYLYLYNVAEQVKGEMGALTMQSPTIFEGAAGGYDATKVSFDASTQTYTTNAVSSGTSTIYWTKQFLNGEFKNNDTVITEFEYTPSNLNYTGNEFGSNPLGSVWVTLRYNGTGGTNIQLLFRTNGPQNLVYINGSTFNLETNINHVVNNQTVKVKAIHDNEKVTLYLDGVCVLKEKKFTDVKGDANTADVPPIIQLGAQNMNLTVSNLSIRKADTVISNVTPLTDDNNLLKGQFAEIYSNVDASSYWEAKPDAVIKETNIYSDMTYNTLTSAGFPADNCWSGELFSFFGSNNSKLRIAPNESYVLSTLARVSNTRAQNSDYTSRLAISVAKYNGVKAWYFIDDTTMSIYTDKLITTINLASEIGYTVGDYIRLTTLVSPFGYDVYANGVHLYTFDGGDGSDVDYSVMDIGVYGAQVRLLDTSIHYNYENGELYKEKILESVEYYEVDRKGIWYEDKAENDVIVAQIKSACESLSTTSNETLKQYVGVVNEAIASGKVTNNMVWDGTTTIGETASLDLDGTANAGWSYDSIPINNGCTYAEGDVVVYEADVHCVSGWSNRRVGFGLTAAPDGDIMIQNNQPHYYATENNTWKYVTTISNTWQTGEKWHIQVIIKAFESIQTVITNVADGASIWDSGEIAWTDFAKVASANSNTVFYPRFYFACGDYKLSNIYAGYDVTNDVASLSTAVTDAKAVSTEGYTAASINAFNEAIAAAETIANACTDPYTNPYSKAEINAAEAAIATTQAALKEPTAHLEIGGGEVNKTEHGIAHGEVLPTGYVGEDKYIIGWTLDGAAVTNYDASVTDVTKYVADFIDTYMLDVAWQQNTKEGNSTVYRFIGSVNDTDKYSAVGFEFSLDGNKWYDLGNTTTVYEKIKENNGSKTAAQIYGTDYSEYLFVQPLNFGSYTEVYVRSYVILVDGETVVYGETSLKDVSEYGKN